MWGGGEFFRWTGSRNHLQGCRYRFRSFRSDVVRPIESTGAEDRPVPHGSLSSKVSLDFIFLFLFLFQIQLILPLFFVIGSYYNKVKSFSLPFFFFFSIQIGESRESNEQICTRIYQKNKQTRKKNKNLVRTWVVYTTSSLKKKEKCIHADVERFISSASLFIYFSLRKRAG